MNLLIITQKVDESDHNLGFFTRWIEEFAKYVSQVTVICLEEGEHHLPANVSVYSLGKENITASSNYLRAFAKVTYSYRLIRYIVLLRGQYDAVFVHMNPEYVLLGGVLWRFFRKKVGFWYTHQSVRLLRTALPFAQYVFTPARESFPLRTEKVRVVGHGIDTKLFVPRSQKSSGYVPVILSDTRITPSKRVERTLELSRDLRKRGVAHTMQIIGAAITDRDRDYEKELRALVVKEHLPVSFVGGVPFWRVPDYYGAADLFVNHANVGALNKTVLQAMAMNLPVVTSNESYRSILPDADIVSEGIGEFAKRVISRLRHLAPVSFRERILENHSLHALIPKILHAYAA